ncbi:hypothetical protein GPECTOR_64g138 [Gonium pectorale]|uniref:Uncharacterized protein n=1 Tax=Gonium pectorale TaxID=33097 RepID=A0A150G491_GONPE|nr:hypothetical protein GPECTOR_64g138 [Gonium pectorale]|eukprot:KXZ44644.1 hypothetical protein GPECTOR_64g138 [Gonium pectorale]
MQAPNLEALASVLSELSQAHRKAPDPGAVGGAAPATMPLSQRLLLLAARRMVELLGRERRQTPETAAAAVRDTVSRATHSSYGHSPTAPDDAPGGPDAALQELLSVLRGAVLGAASRGALSAAGCGALAELMAGGGWSGGALLTRDPGLWRALMRGAGEVVPGLAPSELAALLHGAALSGVAPPPALLQAAERGLLQAAHRIVVLPARPQGVSSVAGAYPGEAWLADWAAAYLPYLSPDEGAVAGETADAAPAAAAEVLYRLATLQHLPPEPWEAAALARMQPGLRPWLRLLHSVDRRLWGWALGEACGARAADGGEPPSPSGTGSAGQQGQGTADGALPARGTGTMPPLLLSQLAWAVGAHVAACPLPPPSLQQQQQQQQQPWPGPWPAQQGGDPLPAEAAAGVAPRAVRRLRTWAHRRAVFGAALAALAAWAVHGSAAAAAAAAETAKAGRSKGEWEGGNGEEGSLAGGAMRQVLYSLVEVMAAPEEHAGPGGGQDAALPILQWQQQQVTRPEQCPHEEADGAAADKAEASVGRLAAWASCARDVVWGCGAAGLRDELVALL